MKSMIRQETERLEEKPGHMCRRVALWLWVGMVVLLMQPAYAAAVQDIEVTLKATPNPVAPEKRLTYTLVVKNLGNRTARNIVLKDQLPANVVFRSASPDCQFANQSDRQDNIITCKATRLLAGTNVTWSLVVRTPADEGRLKNTATVTFDGTDANPDNNQAVLRTTVSASNAAPVAHDISLQVKPTTPYVQQQLIGTDPDNDTVSYVLDAPEQGRGYTQAYVNPTSGRLFVTLKTSFKGTIVLPYRVSDGKRFSPPAQVNLVVRAPQAGDRGLGGETIDPELYAGFRSLSLSNDLFGAPGQTPTEPDAVDLSPNFPAAGDQGRQSSCVGWAATYALKSYQEAVEMQWPFQTGHLFSPAYVYNQINGGRDEGSQIYDALDLMIAQGAATLATMPYSDTDYLSQPSQAARQEAARFKAVSRSIVNGTKAIKAALANRKPVVIGMSVYDQFYNLRGADSVYNSTQGSTGGAHGRHAITVVGYDNNRYGGALKVINSWGGGWGDQGYFWMPYTFAEQVVFQAWVLEDGKNQDVPDDPDDVPPVGDMLPNLQIKSWNARFDPVLGGTGEMEWSVVNSGTAQAPAGATVAIILSKDDVVNPSDTYVIYDQIPFALRVGGTAYRSFQDGNSIPFTIPGSIEPGDYYMALWVDDLNHIEELKEDDNISLSSGVVQFADTLPDLSVQSWYAAPYDFFGNYALTYQILNAGTRTAPKNFSVSLVLSTTPNLGDGNQRWLFFEKYPFNLPSGFIGSRDINSPGYFNLYVDVFSKPIPAGYYYMAFWVDSENNVTESDKANNTSFSWGLISTYRTASGRSASPVTPALQATPDDPTVSLSTIPATAPIFNGKQLPQASLQMRQVRISDTPQGHRKIAFLDTAPAVPAPQALQEKVFQKTLQAEDRVIFPTQDATPMPVAP